MKFRRFDFWGLAGTLGVWAVFGTCAGYLGGRIWFADYFAHLRPLYLLILLPLALVFLARSRVLALMFGMALLLNAFHVSEAWWPRAPRGAGDHSMLVLNVQNVNRRFGHTLNFIRRENPDLILLLEVDRHWAASLSALATEWPYSRIESRRDSYGIALLSRYPLRDMQIRYPAEGWIPVLDATCVTPSGRVRILGAHPFPPWGRTATLTRNAILEAVATMVYERDLPTVLAGDLNVTPWSRHFRGLLRGTGLEDAAAGRGWLAGWPASWPSALRIPKAHVLAGHGVTVQDLQLGPDVGSDHRPLVATFSLEPRR